MKKTLLGLALSCAAVTGMAAEYDDRWMLTPMLNFNATDNEKNLESDFGLGLGLGKFFNDKWSVDFEYDRVSLDLDAAAGSVTQTGLGVMARYHFNEGSSLRPFLGAGVGWLDHDGSGSVAANAIDSSDMMLNLGLGLRKKVTDRIGFITEVKYRLDTDDYTGTASSYDDWLYSMGLNIALGAASKAAPAAAIVEPAPQLDSDGDGVSDQTDRCPNTPAGMAVDAYGCHDGDTDNDGVKDSRDKCPNSRAGAVVDADGCEVQVVIELQGVYFDTDKSTLKPESIAILNAAVATLGEHGSIAVEVGGHTDSKGSEGYNQRLSERRAKVVYEYLVNKGISANRMTWRGYGELSPIATNDTAEGRAKNRRTELVIQD